MNISELFSEQVFSEFPGRDACGLVKLPAEMFDVFIAALFRDLGDALFRVGEEVFCLAESEINDVVHTRNSKLLFVEQLQMPLADVQLLCHFTDCPWKLRIVGDLSAQHEQLVVVHGGGSVQDFIAQF